MSAEETYELYLRVADDEDDAHLYLIEHWFADAPDAATVAMLFADAKGMFETLYPGVVAEDFSVEVRRLRPVDVHGPQLPDPRVTA